MASSFLPTWQLSSLPSTAGFGGQTVISALQASGFTAVVAWALYGSNTGDLGFSDKPLVKDGQCVADTAWPDLPASGQALHPSPAWTVVRLTTARR